MSAFEEGRAAYEAAGPQRNPYGVDDRRRFEWRAGFFAAMRGETGVIEWRDLTTVPANGDRALTSSRGYVTIGTREGDEWFSTLGHRLVMVDHWAPIPRGATDSLGVKYPTSGEAAGAALQTFLAEVAKEFGGKLPGDAWHLYLAKGCSPAEAAAEHRRIVGATQ